MLTKSSVSKLKALLRDTSVDAGGCLEKSDLVASLLQATDNCTITGLWAAQSCPAPSCVCRSSLQRVDGLERFKQSLGERASNLPDAELQHSLRQLQHEGGTVVVRD